ncbi:hypothetical protein E2C01_101048 [Portunus trituberculatus]|uniref:Uncharacterized protein n=1 Tax=Portunus trituberculatus TaxID=210409 RepID=A0A5B7K9M5_PORTR|nr:hypothetical protein [Portunus trituberculatus]
MHSEDAHFILGRAIKEARKGKGERKGGGGGGRRGAGSKGPCSWVTERGLARGKTGQMNRALASESQLTRVHP